MAKYERKTRDVWDIEVDYGYGFEVVTQETSASDARQMARDYISNEHRPTRIRKHRVRRETV